MKIFLIARRELSAYLRSPAGYIIASLMLLLDGILFYLDPFRAGRGALGRGAKLSSDVLEGFFFNASGVAMLACVLFSMRLLAEERQTGTIVLLYTSPIREAEVVMGKYVSALILFAGMTLLTAYMPALIFVNGKVSLGHIVSGYLGLLLLGSATLSIGLFASSLTRIQVLAAILATAIVALMLLLWVIGQATDAPFTDVMANLALHNRRFQPFQKGILELSNVGYYLAVSYVFLLATTKVLESRRWR
jgi:gliding motility-associated transport system permease protein